MKLKNFITLGLLIISGLVVAQQQDNPFEDVRLPSEETYKDIEQMTSPGLRAGPPDIDGSEKPNKVPLSAPSIYTCIGLLALGGVYTIFKTNQQKKTCQL